MSVTTFSISQTHTHTHCSSTHAYTFNAMTDLQLRLTSVDVVGGLVELLQLPLEDREQQRDDVIERHGGERNVL